MLADDNLAASAPQSGRHGTRSLPQKSSRGEILFQILVFVLYALIVGLVTTRHEMWLDEVQAWLLVRNSHSLSELFHALRYEGHPALWYLFLYVPAHLSPNPETMQAVNYIFALCEAALLLSARQLHRSLRFLLVFSYFLVFQYGVIARSYMLATLLLTAAVLCLVAPQRRPRLAVLFLALSINTHVFAIALVVPIAVWQFIVKPAQASKRPMQSILAHPEFRFASLVLLLALVAAWFTFRPARDIASPLGQRTLQSVSRYTMHSEAAFWNAMMPVSELPLSPQLKARLDPAGSSRVLSEAVSIILCLLLAAALRSASARLCFLAGTALLLIEIGATAHVPSLHRIGMVFTAYLLALLIDAYTQPPAKPRPAILRLAAFAFTLVVLSAQALVGCYLLAADWQRPYSQSKEVSAWLQSQGFANNPLVIGYRTLPVVAYLHRSSAYLGNWGSEGSYAVWNSRFNDDWTISTADLARAGANSQLPVILVDRQFSDQEIQKLGVVELKTFPHDAILPADNYSIYLWRKP